MMGRGEEASGGRERASALADAYEALIGAMYLDSDYVTVRRIVLTEARELLESLDTDSSSANPKGSLQEILQSISPIGPTYPIIHQSGPEHEKKFIARILWNGMQLGEGQGRSKKEAEVSAASNALQRQLWKTAIAKQRQAAEQQKNGDHPAEPNDANSSGTSEESDQ
jgi:ribonuclease-3